MAFKANRRFWDEKAKENAFWYVSSFGPYQRRDTNEFWQSGKRIWQDLKGATGYAPSKADVVVEIGCGVGRLSRAISPEVGLIHAFDISDEMIAISRKACLPNVNLFLASGSSLRPVPDRSADFVVAYCVFQHLPNLLALREYLVEMSRVAKSNATIAFSLSPRDWRVHLRLLSQVRAWIREKITSQGPRGLWKREWCGIRPSIDKVRRLSPLPLKQCQLHGDKWLFWAQRP